MKIQEFTQAFINSKGEVLNFTFVRVIANNSIKYTITVNDGYSKRHVFDMKTDFDRWSIIDAPKVPDWIHALQGELAIAIEANEIYLSGQS